MKEYYTVKDIIFGLRPEYLDNERQLKILKELCYSLDKNVSDFYFYIHKQEKELNPQIYCNFIQNIKTLRGLIIYFQQKNNLYVHGRNICKVNINNEGLYFIDSNYYKANIKEENLEQFSLLAKQILSSEFVNNLELVHYYDDEVPGIHIEPSMFWVDGYFLKNPVSLQYTPSEDKIFVVGTKEMPVYNEIIYEMFNAKIPSNLLTEYIINLIDNSNIKDKEVQISNDYGLNNNYIVDFNINESDDTIFLERTKYKKKILY